MPDYTTYTAADFLDDSSFIRWGKGEEKATALWEAWLATNPANAAVARAAQQQLRLLLSAEPVPVGKSALHSIWVNINHSIVAEQQARALVLVRRRWQRAAVVATVLAGVGLGAWLLTRPVPLVLLTTSYGQFRQLTLPDGTRVQLNAHSSLRYPHTWASGHPREVWLTGEAFFNVRHLDSDNYIAPGERFVVHAGPLNVEVLGTTFDVKQRRAVVQVVLQSGRVQVAVAGGAAAPLALAPREAARYDSLGAGSLRKLPAASIEAALAWTEKRLVLHHTPVNDILQTLRDLYGYRTVLADVSLGMRQLEGEISLSNERDVLLVLGTILHVPVTKRDSTIYFGLPAH